MLAGRKEVLLDLQLTRNSSCIQETYRTFSHYNTLVGNSGTHLEQGSGNHSDTG